MTCLYLKFQSLVQILYEDDPYWILPFFSGKFIGFEPRGDFLFFYFFYFHNCSHCHANIHDQTICINIMYSWIVINNISNKKNYCINVSKTVISYIVQYFCFYLCKILSKVHEKLLKDLLKKKIYNYASHAIIWNCRLCNNNT